MTNNFTPVLPMKEIIIFPEMVAPVFIPKDKATIVIQNSLLSDTHEIILLAQKALATEAPSSDNLYQTGVLGRVIQILKMPDGSVRAFIEGFSRIKVTDFKQEGSLISGKYQVLNDINAKDKDINSLIKITLDKFNQYIQKSTKISPENLTSVSEIQEAGKLADIMATYLSVDISEKQQIIESLNTYDRLELVNKILSREIEELSIEQSLQEKVTSRLGKHRRKYY